MTQPKTYDRENYVTEPARRIPTAGKFEVIVAGGGPAGYAAALRSAREGCQTLLIERQECLGGIWTSGLMPWILDFANKTGIMKELCEELKKRGGYRIGDITLTAPPEEIRVLLEEQCVKAGVTIRYGTMVTSSITDNRNIQAVITESKSGREAWDAEIYIDATGDGDLAALSGCRFDYGNSEGLAQPATLCAMIGGVDPEQVKDFLANSPGGKQRLLDALLQAGVHPTYEHPSIFHYGCGIMGLMSHHAYGVCGFDANSRTRAILSGRAELHRQVQALRTLPGWEKLVLIGTAAQLGIREARRIQGRKQITIRDLNQQDFPEDTICIPRFGIDIHAPDPEKCRSVLPGSPRVRPEGYGIPYGSLISADMDNLLMAGRCISGDFSMHASYRVSGNAVALGEAAGCGAARAVRRKCRLWEVNDIPCFSSGNFSGPS